MKFFKLLNQQRHQFAQKCFPQNIAHSFASNSFYPQPAGTSSISRRTIQQFPATAEKKARGITILLLHAAEPRSNFYAKAYLEELLQRHFHLPNWLSSSLTNFYFKFANLPKECVQNSVNYPLHLEALNRLTNRLENSVTKLLPEFGPTRCLPAADHEEPNVERQLRLTFSVGLDHLILLAISPLLQPERIAAQLAVINQRIRAQTNPIKIGEDVELPGDGEDKIIEEYVPRMAPSSKFSLLVVDQVPSSECIVQYWASRLVPLLDRYKVIVFTSPYPLFSFSQSAADLESISRRIMYAAYKHSPRTTPWRFCFYSGWELPIGRAIWLNRLSIQGCLAKLRKQKHKGPVLVVPLDSLFRGFNTQTALPRAIGKLADASGFVVNILQPEPDDKALVHSLAELIKNVMLNRQKFAT